MRPLSDRLRGRALPVSEIVRHGIGIADALRDIHDRDGVYGCLNPSNILLGEKGIRLAPADPAHIISPYAAPEQLRGKYDDPRSDIFTLGAILYEMASGSRAFDSRNTEELRTAILEHPTAPLEAVPRQLAKVVKTCLEKRPEQRFQRAQLVAAQLKMIAASLRETDLLEEVEEVEEEVEAVAPRAKSLVMAANATAHAEAVSTSTSEPVTAVHEPVAAEPEKKRAQCPKCKSTDVRASRPKESWEDHLADFGVKFCRCHRCYHRFMHLAFMKVSLDS